MKVLMLMFFALFSVLVSEPLIAQEQSAVGSSTVRVEDLLDLIQRRLHRPPP